MNKTSMKFVCALYKIIQMFDDTNSIHNGTSSQNSDETADSVGSTAKDGDMKFEVSEPNDRKVFEGIKAYSCESLTEPQIRRIRLMNSLFILSKGLENYKECMISSLVYLDKLTQNDFDITSQNLNWIVLCCICIADKLFNDSPIANRVYAFKANIRLEKFNRLETKILKKLQFNVNISPSQYHLYKEELGNFCENRTKDLEKLYQDYKHDKRELKKVKENISIQQLYCKTRREHYSSENNYSDPDMSEAMTKVSQGFFSTNFHENAEKFRFESYDSNILDEICTGTKVYRSRSQTSLTSQLKE
ncbi:unnamed protein product [Moneuplotes crassus]|uniref:Cyclin N-terminal domain-containing protein n=1 Tax=Euplotes crassus TaxID=5936 RepID=A0AAD1Y9J3_EUPCR|nr:unnamed protein product [Moneuplotes crassus]